MKRIFIDTEFTSLTREAKLISLGASVEEIDGKVHTFYVEIEPYWEPSEVSEFAREHVLPLLTSPMTVHIDEAGRSLANWITSLKVPCVIAVDSLNYDWQWVLLLLRDRWPENLLPHVVPLTVNYLHNYDQFEEALEQEFTKLCRHHALADAIANHRAWKSSGGDVLGDGSDV